MENITSSMDNVALASATCTVYLVKQECSSSAPEGGLAIFVYTNEGEDSGDIHFIKSGNASVSGLSYQHQTIRVDEINQMGENLMPIGTTPAQKYPGSWVEVMGKLPLLLANESNQHDMLTLLDSPLKVSQWTQLARPTLKNAGLLKEIEAAPTTFHVRS
ncbi:hypothetical protein N7453_003592 [Penicillium expansum]|nr:hypothetical protein N7453_003592 [Penicillium expansum]